MIEESLQKLTDTEITTNSLLSQKKIKKTDLQGLNEDEKSHLFKTIAETFNRLEGEERDIFFEKVEDITANVVKNQIWENNHYQITTAISNFLQSNGRMPSKTEIALKAGLSRQTIHKHLKDFGDNELFKEHVDQFRFMASNLLATVFSRAMTGDMGAAKLFFNVTGCLNGQSINTNIQNQNNYIQINGTILSQETIKALKPEQLNLIEGILKTAITQPLNQ